MISRIEELEFRTAHQEAAIEELTQTTLDQQQQIARLELQLKHLHALVRQLPSGAVGPADQEPPPPHY